MSAKRRGRCTGWLGRRVCSTSCAAQRSAGQATEKTNVAGHPKISRHVHLATRSYFRIVGSDSSGLPATRDKPRVVGSSGSASDEGVDDRRDFLLGKRLVERFCLGFAPASGRSGVGVHLSYIHLSDYTDLLQ